jgi:hypothetical protein
LQASVNVNANCRQTYLTARRRRKKMSENGCALKMT